MSKEKNQKIELRLQNREDTQEVDEAQPTRVKNSMSFDLYFQKLMAKDRKIMPHHKAAMRKYAENKGKVEADEKEFDDIFRVY